MKTLIYDCEIEKAILGKKESKIPEIEYCDGWHDHENMGISVIGALEYNTGRSRVFMEDNMEEFEQAINETDFIVGFNNYSFDDELVLATTGVEIPKQKTIDLLVAIWAAAGLGPKFQYPSHAGYSLDAICDVNFNIKKTGHGAFAPVDWQQGRIGKVVDYCLNDIYMTELLLTACLKGPIKCPKTGKELYVEIPL